MVVPLLDEIPSSTKRCAGLSLPTLFRPCPLVSVPAHPAPSQPVPCPFLPPSLPARSTAIPRAQLGLVLILNHLIFLHFPSSLLLLRLLLSASITSLASTTTFSSTTSSSSSSPFLYFSSSSSSCSCSLVTSP
ncbi:hypothetical protein E2C01_058123 [Portunus trituberculatus]|uniref:Uncharacterized protein n=1 Tax=Portunus trituberculatus TaxID=210409 RepID=A0A5B7H1T2_PORTR|nr:hypothetical protein [Portunus trituberculatus]